MWCFASQKHQHPANRALIAAKITRSSHKRSTQVKLSAIAILFLRKLDLVLSIGYQEEEQLVWSWVPLEDVQACRRQQNPSAIVSPALLFSELGLSRPAHARLLRSILPLSPNHQASCGTINLPL